MADREAVLNMPIIIPNVPLDDVDHRLSNLDNYIEKGLIGRDFYDLVRTGCLSDSWYDSLLAYILMYSGITIGFRKRLYPGAKGRHIGDVDTYPPLIADGTYAVALPKSYGKVISVAMPLTTDHLFRYISKSVVLHAGLPLYFGAWIDNGLCYLDHTLCTDDINLANYIGHRGKQQAIWHFKSKSAIPCLT